MSPTMSGNNGGITVLSSPSIPSSTDVENDAVVDPIMSTTTPPGGDPNLHHPAAIPPPITSTNVPFYRSLYDEVWKSSSMLFQTKVSWLLVAGPLALFGDATGIFGEALCFSLSGIALIPCAERLSYVTEQVAEHTNGTIGALLNATFGNAPELLIATAALQAGFYRVVQLAMLGSMLTNLLFVFGLSALVGGLRWQVQELRITSGNVSVGLLLVSVAASLLPAALIQSGQLLVIDETDGNNPSNETSSSLPSQAELTFSRVNAFVMVVLYGCYLVFQLGTHKEEFDDEPATAHHHVGGGGARKNTVCLGWFQHCRSALLFGRSAAGGSPGASGMTGDIELAEQRRGIHYSDVPNNQGDGYGSDQESKESTEGLLDHDEMLVSEYDDDISESSGARLQRRNTSKGSKPQHQRQLKSPPRLKSHNNLQSLPSALSDHPSEHNVHGPTMSFRVGIVWLFLITLCISALSDILVDTVDGFAERMNIGEVFVSMVILPYFSNVAEQVSAVIFAYRNEMDLCVGVTVGSAIQVATFVLPGTVLIGWMVDRSMTLYLHGYETACLFLAVVTVAAILQGGTTNWLVGVTCIGIYIMLAAGFWFHAIEDLSVDAEKDDTDSSRLMARI